MARKWSTVIAVLFLMACGSFLLRKQTVSFTTKGKTIGLAKRGILPDLNAGAVNVYFGDSKAFSLWEDAFHGPVFIYPFSDGKRFLCDYDDDTAKLVFVVDFNILGTNSPPMTQWLPQSQLGADLARLATNVVFDTHAAVRLPSTNELHEVVAYIGRASEKEIKALSFPFCDLGLYRTYLKSNNLLADFAINRQSYWP